MVQLIFQGIKIKLALVSMKNKHNSVRSGNKNDQKFEESSQFVMVSNDHNDGHWKGIYCCIVFLLFQFPPLTRVPNFKYIGNGNGNGRQTKKNNMVWCLLVIFGIHIFFISPTTISYNLYYSFTSFPIDSIRF